MTKTKTTNQDQEFAANVINAIEKFGTPTPQQETIVIHPWGDGEHPFTFFRSEGEWLLKEDRSFEDTVSSLQAFASYVDYMCSYVNPDATDEECVQQIENDQTLLWHLSIFERYVNMIFASYGWKNTKLSVSEITLLTD